jgi:integrase
MGAQESVRTAVGDEWNPLGLVWTGERGGHLSPDSMTKTFKRFAREAGSPALRLHDLRHAHATALVELSAHPRTIQQRLGHSSAAFTMNVYASDNDALDAEAATAFGMRFNTRLRPQHKAAHPGDSVSLETR